MARLTVSLHNGGYLTIREDSPEVASLNRLGELMCLKTCNSEVGTVDVELVTPDCLPERRHSMRSTSLTEFAASEDWSRVFIAGWKKTPLRPHFYQCFICQAALICAGMNAILRGGRKSLRNDSHLGRC